jgi:hypothetical protein
MKRLAMNFQPAPVDGLPSYLEMATARSRGMQNLLPRWWLAPNYERLRRDHEGLVWEIRGQGVKCLTEDDAISSTGERRQTGKQDATAKRWADAFTARFEDLANEDSTFAQLRNVMDLAVAGALIGKEEFIKHAGLSIPRLLGEELLDRYNAPRAVASQASFVKKRGGWLISASGGVQIEPWEVTEHVEVITDPVLASHTPTADRWWWDGK